jgi:hypothetical protein
MKRDKVYISGPISSRPLDLAIHHFTLAEVKLQAQGYRTCNPLKMRLCVWLAQHGHYRICLLLQLLWMWIACDRIYLLEGWHRSDGARLERAAARVLGMKVMREGKPSPFSRAAEAVAQMGRAVSALGNVPAPTHVLTPEKKTSKKHKKD